MLKTYFKNSFVSLHYDKELSLGIAEWKGSVKGAEFREAVLICLYLIDRFEIKFWLADDRKMKSLDPADVQWANDVFLPRVVESPLQRMARLPSEHEENRQVVEVLIKKAAYTENLVLCDFDNEEVAMQWLLRN